MKFFFYRQFDSMDCGPTCLQMIARFYKKKERLENIREICGINKEGVNMLGISNAAVQLGFNTSCIKLSTKQLKTATLPAIVHWNQNHFVVLYKIINEKFFIADPAKGSIVLKGTAFNKYFCNDSNVDKDKGIVLLIEPSEHFSISSSFESKKHEYADEKKTIFTYGKSHSKPIALALLLVGVTGALQLLFPYITKNIVDKGIKGGNLNLLQLMLLAQLCIICGRLAVDFIRNLLLLKVGSRINMSILSDFILKLMKLPLSFFDARKKGSIMQRMQDHSRIESFITGSALNIVFSVVTFFAFSVIIAMYSLKIFIIFLIGAVVYSAWVLLFTARRRQIDYERFDISAQEQNASMQLLEGMHEIKLFGMENSMQKIWHRLQQSLFTINYKIFTLNQWQQNGGILINEIKNIIIIFLAANLVIGGELSLGTMMAIQVIIGQLNSPIEQFLAFYQNWQYAHISMMRLNEIHQLADEQETTLSKNHQLKILGGKIEMPIQHTKEIHALNSELSSLTTLNQAISFRKVSYTYPGAGYDAALKDISMDILEGKTTAIVGMSGSGKTTILKLLLKYFEPETGQIKLHGVPFSDIRHDEWRRRCGVVMQESYIFPESIEKNITLGEDTIDHQKILRATEIANISDFIKELPLGFGTKIGVDGYGLSTGQKQRILIARAVYRNPEFIFFDEATNSLDANNEKQIHDNLHDFFINKTVVIVAHRLSTVKSADHIIMLQNGRIVERGTHIELINKKGAYHKLVKNQMS